MSSTGGISVEHGVRPVVVERKMTKHDGAMSLPAEISGKEAPAGHGSALDALIDFYRSFNASDLNALAANWADGEAPSMDNPIGSPARMACHQGRLCEAI